MMKMMMMMMMMTMDHRVDGCVHCIIIPAVVFQNNIFYYCNAA